MTSHILSRNPELAATTLLFTWWLCVLSELTSLIVLESFKNEVGLLAGIFNVLEICHPETPFGTIL